jgi:hypothetical protein
MHTPTSGVDAFVCGDNGKIWRSTNQGSNWVERSIGTTKKINSIGCVTLLPTMCAAVGDSGLIYRTLNGGANWENKSISSSVSLYKVVSQRYDRFCAVGTGGAIYTSTDYGNSWQPRISNTTNHLRDVMFSGPDSGVAVGDNGTVRLTTNSGLTWFSDSYFSGLTSRDIISVAKVDGNTVNSITRHLSTDNSGSDTTFFLAVSSEPFIGIEPISTFIAEVFSLKQNYPNPFNPDTKIRFDIPKKNAYEEVKLIIYDAVGNEVTLLLSEPLRPGQYEINWDASNYPSGVYFYQLVTSKYTETKKMVLVK